MVLLATLGELFRGEPGIGVNGLVCEGGGRVSLSGATPWGVQAP